jgi:ribosomal protein S18 acetylase RimI-like enzyme
VIRVGELRDVEAVLGLWRAAGSLPSVTDSAEALAALLERDPGALLVSEADGVIVGSLVASFDGWRGGFYRLAVAPARRRGGIATRLVRAGEARLGELGCARISVIVDTTDGAARRFWAAAGYELQAERSRYVHDLR